MVFVAPLIGAVSLLAGFAAGLPRPDSAIGGEVAVSAPNGIVLSDTAELASQLSSESAATATATWYPAATTTPVMMTAAPAYGGGYAPPPSSAAPAYTPAATYGSGSSNWGNQDGYNACVQQCVASFGAPPAMYTPPPTATTGSSSGSGSGVTHTVIVAPTQGVLRYVPFAVNASIGDTVHFVWNANNHTVTKSSELELCNKTSDAPFASGTHDQGFTFDQVVNDTNPTFFYCGTPGHCQKGMFGIINPPSVANANTSVSTQMPALVAANPDLSAMNAYVNTQTTGNLAASTWGQNIDLAGLPDWAHTYVAENVLYARTFMAQNPDVINPDGSINMETTAPLMFPADLSGTANAASASSSASSTPSAAAATAPPSSSPSTSPSSAASGAGTVSGAGRTVVSGGLFAVAAIAASFLAL